MTKNKAEGKLTGCYGHLCGCGCCDDDQVEEWVVEYFAYHDKIKNYLISRGIEIEFADDRVRFHNCSDGKNCKFLKYSTSSGVDIRPIDCKIYPFAVDWHTIDFDKKIVYVYYNDDLCPLYKAGKITDDFKKEVEKILRRDFAFLFYGTNFEFVFKDEFIDMKYEKLHGWLWKKQDQYRGKSVVPTGLK